MKGKIVVTFSSSTRASAEFQLLYKWHFETGNWNIESADVQIRTAAKTWWACEFESQAELAVHAPWQTLAQVVTGEKPLNCPRKSSVGICVYLWAVFEDWLWWLVMNLCASLGCFWRLIAVVGNEFVASLGCFWRLIAVVGNEFELERIIIYISAQQGKLQ